MSMSEAKTEIANAIKSGTTHYKEIAKKLGKTDGNIRKTLSVMKKAGQVIILGGGHYQLPKKIVSDPIPNKPGPESLLRPEDYVNSNEKGLRLLIKTREIVNKLMIDYEKGEKEFPGLEITALEKLERIYKEQIQTKTKEGQEEVRKDFKKFIILPDNHRSDLTLEQQEDQVMYELLQLGKIDVPPSNNVIIEKNDEQISFPFYSL